MTTADHSPDRATLAGEAYDAVLFDMDGVLLRGPATPAEVYRRATARTIETFGLDPTAEQRSILERAHLDEAYLETCAALDVVPDAFWATREENAAQLSHERLREGERKPFHDAAVLDSVRAPLGLVSNNRHATAQFVASRRFPGRFEFVRGRDPTIDGFRRRKPNPYYLNEAMLVLDAETAIYVGDRETDVRAAEAAGIDSAFVRRPHNANVSLSTEPTHELAGLDQLSAISGLQTSG